jgi:2,5-furandicarboxylate decarboxylase 1
MAIKSLREWLAVIDKEGKLKRVSRDVKLEYELIAVAKKASSKYAVLFERPVGDTLREDNRMPVVANTMVSREDFSKLLGVPVIELADCLMRAQDNPIAPVIVDKKKSPAKEVVIKDVNLYDLPIPVNHLGDNGAFVTAGVIVARDPATGKRNVSIHRMQLRDKKHLGIFMLPKHLDEFQRSAEKQDRPLEVTISIGLDPILMLASQVTAPLGFDEFGVAGALYGSGLELVAGETVGVEAPANAEIIIEGKIIPHVRTTFSSSR